MKNIQVLHYCSDKNESIGFKNHIWLGRKFKNKDKQTNKFLITVNLLSDAMIQKVKVTTKIIQLITLESTDCNSELS